MLGLVRAFAFSSQILVPGPSHNRNGGANIGTSPLVNQAYQSSALMKTTVAHVVEKSIRIKGTPAQVWDALTDPEKTKKYFFNCEVLSTWKVGSPITFTGPATNSPKTMLQGEIVAVVPEKLLTYTLRNTSDASNSLSTVTDHLEYENGETILSITDDVGKGEGAEARYERSVKGWDMVLGGLKNLVEGNV